MNNHNKFSIAINIWYIGWNGNRKMIGMYAFHFSVLPVKPKEKKRKHTHNDNWKKSPSTIKESMNGRIKHPRINAKKSVSNIQRIDECNSTSSSSSHTLSHYVIWMWKKIKFLLGVFTWNKNFVFQFPKPQQHSNLVFFQSSCDHMCDWMLIHTMIHTQSPNWIDDVIRWLWFDFILIWNGYFFQLKKLIDKRIAWNFQMNYHHYQEKWSRGNFSNVFVFN